MPAVARATLSVRLAPGQRAAEIGAVLERLLRDAAPADADVSMVWNHADPALFERAVGNLVDNALRFTPENGSIQIALAERAKDFEVAVSDNGSGIAPEHLPRVFDRFYRAEPSRGSDGAGLGLALVKSIVDLHGGTARIQSEVGRGTTVRITFPKGA